MAFAINEGNIAIYRYTGTQAIGTTVANMLFDNTVLQETGYSIATSDTVTLAGTGHYLVTYSLSAGSTGGINRSEYSAHLEIGGTDSPYGRTTGYIRRTGGTDEAFPAATTIIETATTNVAIQLEALRTDSNTGTVGRRANESGLQFLKLNDNWPYIRTYDSAGTQTFDTNVFATITFDTNDELDTGFSRTGGDITLADPGHYLVTYNVHFQNASTTARRGVETRLTLDGTEIDGTRVTGYLRGTNNTQDHSTAWAGIIETSGSNQILRLQGRQEGETVTAGITNIANETALTAVKLPDTADFLRLGETGGGQAVDTTALLDFDEDIEVDSDSFTHPSGSGQVIINEADHYLFLGSFYSNSRSTTNIDRIYPRLRWRLNGADVQYGTFGKFNRGDQGTTSTFTSGHAGAAILPNLSVNDVVELLANDESTGTDATHVYERDRIVMHGLRIPSLFENPANMQQLHFRWRDDTTALNTAGGYLAAEDDNTIGRIATGTTVRLRMELANVSNSTAQDMAKAYELQFGLKSSDCGSITTWTGVGDASDAFNMFDSTNISPDAQSATPSLLANGEGYTFAAGHGMDIADTTPAIAALGSQSYTEIEYSFQVTNQATLDGVYCFRLFDTTSGTTLDLYSAYPQLRVLPSGYLVVYRDTGTDDITTTSAPLSYNTRVQAGEIATMPDSNSGIILANTGHYLVGYNVAMETSAGANRSEVNMNLELAGVDLAYGRSTGYVRRTGGTDEAWPAGSTIIEVANENDILQVEALRTDSNTATVRRRDDESGFMLLKLPDTWSYARIREVGGGQTFDNSTFAAIDFDTPDELDTGFSHSTTDITIAEPGHYLVTYNVMFRNASTTARRNAETRLTLDGTEIDGSRVTAYLRGTNSTQDHSAAWGGIIEISGTNQVLQLQGRQEGETITAGITNVANQSSITLVKLPDTADYVRLGEIGGGQDVDTNAVLSFDENLELDTNSFSHTPATGRVTMGRNGDYLFFGSFYSNTRTLTLDVRHYPRMTWQRNGSNIPYGTFGKFNRGENGTTGTFSSGNAGMIIIPDVSGGDYVELFASDESTGTDALHVYEADRLGLFGLRIQSLFEKPANVQQLHFRWRDDTTALNTDGGYLAAEDSNAIGFIDKGTTVRLRLEVANIEEATAQDLPKAYELQWGQKMASCGTVTTWTGVGDATDAFDLVDSSNITNGQSATPGLLSNSEGHVFTAGNGMDTADTTSLIGPLSASGYTEVEYSLAPTSSATDGTTYCFRLFDTTSGTTLNLYAAYPELSITPTDRYSVYSDASSTEITTTTAPLSYNVTVKQGKISTMPTTGSGVVLHEVGHYLVGYNVAIGSLAGANRNEVNAHLDLNGTDLAYGRGGGYLRRIGGTDEAWFGGAAVIETSAADEVLQVEAVRTDSNTAQVARRPDESGLMLLKLDDTWSYARITENGGGQAFSTTTFEDVTWDNDDELDGTFSRAGADITLATPGHYLVTYNVMFQNSSTVTRTNAEARLTLDGTEIDGTRTVAYMRGSEGSQDQPASWAGIIVTSGLNQILRVQARQEGGSVGANVTNVGGQTAVTITKLPNVAHYVRLGEIAGGQVVDTAAVITWDETIEEDTLSFDHDGTNTERINIDRDGNYLFFGSFYSNSRTAALDVRIYPRWRWRKNSTDVPYSQFGRYNRGDDGTIGKNVSGNAGVAIFPDLLTTDYIELYGTDESTGTDANHIYEADRMGVQGVNIESLFPERDNDHFFFFGF